MKTSTEIGSIANIVGEEKAVELCARAGFDAWDFSMLKMVNFNWKNRCVLESDYPLAGGNYLSFARKLKKIGLDNGIVCNQSHAPFPVNCKQIRDVLKRAVECTAEAGGSICVVHPDNNASPEENAIMYRELVEFSKGYGVKIATENMWNWDKEKNQSSFAACMTPKSFCDHVDAVGSEYMVACVDIGHAEMRGSNTSAAEFIKALGSRVAALHLHDNDKWHDSHALPFSMDIEFEPIIKTLKEINYGGYFTLEATAVMKNYTTENALDGVKLLFESARRLAKMYDAL